MFSRSAADDGPSTTVYNRFNRWSRKRFWTDLVEALATSGAVAKSTSIDSTHVKAHGSAHGGKGGEKSGYRGFAGRANHQIHVLTDVIGRPFAFILTGGNDADSPVVPHLLTDLKGERYLLAVKGYDANDLRKRLRQSAIVPVIPGCSNRKRPIRYDAKRYKSRHLIENAFCRLKDFRRIATRFDKLARNFLSAVALATLVAFWP